MSPILPIPTGRAEVIVRFEDLPLQDLEPLRLESEAEGFRFVRRLRDDWISGANRFAGPGEAFFGCYLDGRLVAIGGVNRQSVSIGRLQRVYVARNARRTGIGRVLVADRCLHYFSEAETTAIIAEVRRVLRNRGWLLSRVNSVKDTHYGAGQGSAIEPFYYEHDRTRKRFFDEPSLRGFFADWNTTTLREYAMHRYEYPKIVWELAAQKREAWHR